MSEVICTDVLLSTLNNEYDYTFTHCTLLGQNFHDNYIVQTDERINYFIRVYKSGVRKRSEILFELDFINHLRKKGLSVSFPIPRKDASYVTEINSELGKKDAVMFSFASGGFPDPTQEVSYLYGRFIASFQNAAEGFESKYARSFEFNLLHTVDLSLEITRPFLTYRDSDLKYLEKLALMMKDKITKLPFDDLRKGTCHGDLHFMNVYIDKNRFTLFDLDCCANGFLAFDLGTIRWEFAFEDDLWALFLKGYTKIRELNDVERQAIPLFSTVRNIWAIAHNLTYRDIFKVKEFDDEYWDNNMKLIKKWANNNGYL